MSCLEFWNGAPELAQGDEPDLGHLAECRQCAAAFARQRRLFAGLRAFAAESQEVQAPERLEAALIAEFRNQRGRRGRGLNIAAWRTPALALALAAALVLGVGVWMLPKRTAAPAAHHRSQTRVELAMLDETAAQDATSDDGFIPLPNAQRLEPDDDVNVVRMELPRSSMMAVGYEVSEERASEPVQADVMLGPDGLARAVRFVDGAGSF